MESIVEKLSDWVKIQPNKVIWTFLNSKGDPVQQYSYEELDVITDNLSVFLLKCGHLTKGDRVLLVFLPGLDFMVAFIACCKADLIAVPVFPPDPRKLQKDLHHFVSIQKSCNAKLALTNNEYNFIKRVEDIKHIFQSVKWPELIWIPIDSHLKETKRRLGSPSFPSPNSICFLQYTSGSTSEPKGVMISHGNLSDNLTMILKEIDANQATVNLSWLPQYHDMGLIGSYLGVLFCGGSGFYLSPIDFLKNPLIWIKSISKYSATHTQAPNFAYALVARKFSEQFNADWASLDLSSMKHMINAAEPVSYENIANFYNLFSKYRLNANVIFPTYGLAEHTVFVCSGSQIALKVRKHLLEKGTVEVLDTRPLISSGDEMPTGPDEQVLVACGRSVDRTVTIKIVDGDTCVELNDKSIGEVWISSESKACGYWNQPEINLEIFGAELKESTITNDSGLRYLRTGDLGFMHNNHLFICGRLKDLIIIGGSNHYPQDIERSVELQLSEFIRPGCSAAFSLHTSNDSEAIIYVAELKETVHRSEYESITQMCQHVASKEHGISFQTVCLLKSRSIPKTTSGKIARAWCRKGYLDGSLSIIYHQKNESVAENNVVDSQMNHKKVFPKDAPNNTLQIENIFTADQIREMDEEDIMKQLEQSLIQLSTSSPVVLNPPLRHDISLISFGLDSMTIVQFKGIIENRFHADIPDEFVFSSMATLQELSTAVKLGHLSDLQLQKFHQNAQTLNHPPQETVIVATRQPLCPWFTCCY